MKKLSLSVRRFYSILNIDEAKAIILLLCAIIHGFFTFCYPRAEYHELIQDFIPFMLFIGLLVVVIWRADLLNRPVLILLFLVSLLRIAKEFVVVPIPVLEGLFVVYVLFVTFLFLFRRKMLYKSLD